MKRIIMIILAFLFVFSICPVALATNSSEDAANELYSLGLFRGTGTDENGNPVFELEREATRAEALVMLIRLLGKEAEALNGTYSHPFTDVPAWADKYVGYAYENGLTNGISATEFDPSSFSSADVYFTFVLRALGYSDRGDNAQFTYRQAKEYARSIGLTDKDFKETAFLRGDAAEVSLAALSQPLFGENLTLLDELVQVGAVNANTADTPLTDIVLPPEGTTYSLKYDYAEEYHMFYSTNDILSIFPSAVGLLQTQFSYPNSTLTHQEIYDFLGVSEEEYYINQWLNNGRKYIDFKEPEYDQELSANSTWNFWASRSDSVVNVLIIVDNDFQALGIITPNYDGKTATITAWYGNILEMIENTLKDFQYRLGDSANHTLSFDGTRKYEEHFDGRAVGAYYPIYLDGNPLPQGSFLSGIQILYSLKDVHDNPEEALYRVAFAELYCPFLQSAKTFQGDYVIYRQAQNPPDYPVIKYLPDGTSLYPLYEKDETIELRVAFDQDLNVLGYMIHDPYDYS